ncbi:uncharacterized protein LOC129790927 [Lutzomyia longipalpis]|uniref:uncharacterized protein LOC129790927 n=1 Tax=Lutzomyia longipalpis TaxID=7200 RepID=UPI0024845887|nr:uncharacterized protein LOC129790927 [Lutzomyia longipalpis]
MLSPRGFQEIKDHISVNEDKIHLLEEINAVLKERHDHESNYKAMSLKFAKMQKEERERQDEYDKTRKELLSELEHKGAHLCKEHARLLHQIEHIQWHLEGCAKHHKPPCHGKSRDNIHRHHHDKKLPPATAATTATTTTGATSCQSSATTHAPVHGHAHPPARPSQMANLRNTSERLVKHIVDLRKRTFVLQERLEHEVVRKKEMEKKLSEIRKDISRQKKLLSMRRATPLPALPPVATKKQIPAK